MRRAFSTLWTHRLMVSKRSANAIDRAVPQLPAPKMQSLLNGGLETAPSSMSLCSLAALQREHVFLPFHQPSDIGFVAKDDQERSGASRQQYGKRIDPQTPQNQRKDKRSENGSERNISRQSEDS